MTKEQEHAAWSRRNWEMTKGGGSWALPRSGLIFRRTHAGSELATVMPYTPDIAFAAYLHADVPQNAEALRNYQRNDFNIIKHYHELAGLSVTDPQGLLSD
jgi:hypothetical protein